MANANEKSFFEIETAISKALVPLEKPIKVKHIRSVIMSTFTQQGAKVFWSLATRQPVMDQSIVAWKFCQLLHKILNEGHSLCSSDSMQSCEWLIKMGKLWVNMRKIETNFFFIFITHCIRVLLKTDMGCVLKVIVNF